METKGGRLHKVGSSSYRKCTLWYISHWPLVHRRGVEGTRAPLQAPSACLVPGYVAMCSTWPRARVQRPFVEARVAGWGLPLIRGQVFISKGRGRAEKKEGERWKINRNKQGGGIEREGEREKSQPLLPIIGKTSRSFFLVCKEKRGKGGRRRDGRLMAGLCVSRRIVASRGEARHKLTCRRWLQVERRICLAANTCVLVFSAPPPCPFYYLLPLSLSLSFSISSSCCCHPYLHLLRLLTAVLPLNQFTETK